MIGPERDSSSSGRSAAAIEQLGRSGSRCRRGRSRSPFIDETRRLASGWSTTKRWLSRRLAVSRAGTTSALICDAAVAVPRAGPIAGVGVDVRGLAVWPRSGPAPRAGRARRGAATRRSWPSPPRSRAAARHPGSRRPPASQSPRRAARETAPGERPAADSGAAADTTRATVPRVAGTLPGRSTAAHRYCSRSWSTGQKRQQRQVASSYRSARLKKVSCWAPCGAVVGRVQVDRDPPRLPGQPLLDAAR